MMVKNTHFSFSSYFTLLVLWFSCLAAAFESSTDLYDQQLLGVNATWLSGAWLGEQDCCDGNMADLTSLSPFKEGPPNCYPQSQP